MYSLNKPVMPRSPRILKAQKAKLTDGQGGELQKAIDDATAAGERVKKVKLRKHDKREDLNIMRGHLEKLNEQFDAHPLKKKRDEKREDIGIVQGQIEVIGRELDAATVAFQDALRKKDATIDGLKRELERNAAGSPKAKAATRRGVRGKQGANRDGA